MKLPRILKQKGKDPSKIPVGHYCYQYTGETSKVWSKEANAYVTAYHTKECPYSKSKTIKGVRVPYCSFIGMKGWPHYAGSKGFKKLYAKYGEEMYRWLDLLWDGVKECGENYGDLDLQENEVIFTP